jgi:hypothetical protein
VLGEGIDTTDLDASIASSIKNHCFFGDGGRQGIKQTQVQKRLVDKKCALLLISMSKIL